MRDGPIGNPVNASSFNLRIPAEPIFVCHHRQTSTIGGKTHAADGMPAIRKLKDRRHGRWRVWQVRPIDQPSREGSQGCRRETARHQWPHSATSISDFLIARLNTRRGIVARPEVRVASRRMVEPRLSLPPRFSKAASRSEVGVLPPTRPCPSSTGSGLRHHHLGT